ncbi:ATP-dependent DNA helicase DinG [Bacillus smithii]|uniref:ATP-dependent DNA helicase DinG n=1 Tax=Bacillus smithii TaxID=1479 RepID=UPI002E20C80B|nr:ATP-dependent DNA helicase DinG [Bacillus smithii]MED1455606.1 ATP-dependent DNA helicase DinG [Bacillus smithii]
MLPQRFVVVDLETTGNSPKKGDRIIQASLVIIEREQIIDQYTTFINPETAIPAFIEELTGIHEDLVKQAPLFSEAAQNIRPLLDHSIFVAHNTAFDLTFLQTELEKANFPLFNGQTVDTVELARFLYPTQDSYKLSDLAEELGVLHSRPHQADSDAYVTAEILLLMLKKLKSLPYVTLKKLHQLSSHLKSDISTVIQAVLDEKEQSIESLPEDLEVYRNIALKKKKIQKREDLLYDVMYPSSSDEKAEYMKEFPQFQIREAQFEMMDCVYETLDSSNHAFIEAGTGIGKSLAYLLPAAFYSKQHKVPIVISTYTTVLQEQLMNKDLVLLKAILPFSVQTAVLKGRSHYIDLFQFENSLNDETSNYDEALTKMQILVWLTETTTGDKNELNLSSGGELYWARIKQEDIFLNRSKNPWMEKDFYLHSRKQAQQADIIVTNHAILAKDLFSDQNLISDYNQVIIDEAHHFGNVLGDQMGTEIDLRALKWMYQQIGTMEQKQLFFQCEELLKKHGKEASIHFFETDHDLHQIAFEMNEWMNAASAFFLHLAKKKSNSWNKVQIRVGEQERKMKYWKELHYSTERLYELMKMIHHSLQERLMLAKKLETDLTLDEAAMIEKLYDLLESWKKWMNDLKNVIIEGSKQPAVIWMEGDIRMPQNHLKIKCRPAGLDRIRMEQFIDGKKSVIFTSATLSVNRSFQHFAEELGIPEKRFRQAIFPSPFHYEKNCKLIIPNDVPEIQDVTSEKYVEVLADYLSAVAQATNGRMLVLFTSYDMLKNTYLLMKESGLLEDFVLIAQGITNGSKVRLTRHFQKFEKAILFGTSSFWEGVDIPGEDLSCLVLVRLPFTPPDDPLFQAKGEALRAEGKNPFYHSSLPQAVIRFKQGFGRLIRTERDRGIIIVFDRRITTARYGKAFIQSIPKVPILHASLPEVIQVIEDWL